MSSSGELSSSKAEADAPAARRSSSHCPLLVVVSAGHHNPSDLDAQIKAAQKERQLAAGAIELVGSKPAFDTDIYGSEDRDAYVREIPLDEEDEDNDGSAGAGLDQGRGRSQGASGRVVTQHSLADRVIHESRLAASESGADGGADPMAEYRQQHGSGIVNTRIADRESSYHQKAKARLGRALSPERAPAGADGSGEGRSYADIAREAALNREKAELLRRLEKQRQDGILPPPPAAAAAAESSSSSSSAAASYQPSTATAAAADLGSSVSEAGSVAGRKRKRRWDDAGGGGGGDTGSVVSSSSSSTVGYGSTITGVGSSAMSAVTGGGISLHPAAARGSSSRWNENEEEGGRAGGSSSSNHHGVRGFDSDDEEDEGQARKSSSTSSSSSAAAVAVANAGAGAGGQTGARRRSRWDETPAVASGSASSAAVDGDGTPAYSGLGGGDATPLLSSSSALVAAAAQQQQQQQPKAKRSRWDETPLVASGAASDPTAAKASSSSSSSAYQQPSQQTLLAAAAAATPLILSGGNAGATPLVLSGLAAGGETPLLGAPGISGYKALATSSDMITRRIEAEMDQRNRPLSDDELDGMFPPGYTVLAPPATYVPIRTPSRKLTETPAQGEFGGGAGGAGAGGATGFRITETPDREAYGLSLGPGDGTAADGSGEASASGDLPPIRPEEIQYFGKLLEKNVDEDSLSTEEQKERTIMLMLLKIKNGTPPQRKTSLRQLQEKARFFGAGPLFNQILPLMLSPSLEEQERHLLVKVIDRVLFKLGDTVRPYVHKILGCVGPMLIDEDYYARAEGREVIANLSKAAGLATMISVMRPDIDHEDEYVRNTTSRAFSVVASALGIPAMLPFLKAVAGSKKSWQARHTGVKIVQQIAILMGVSVLPHLRLLVDIVAPSLNDDQQKVKMMGALALAALAEASYPYGVECFDNVLRPLWRGIKQQRGKNLAAFLKCIGCIIPLMDPQYASYYTREVMVVVVREFASPEDEMRRIVLKVVKQCCSTEGVDAAYIKSTILGEFFRNFWVRRMALDRRNYRSLIETTVALAEKVGAGEVIGAIVEELKDDSEPMRRMVMECVDKVLTLLGASDVSPRLEEQLLDGVLYAFQEAATVGADEATAGLGGVPATVGLNQGARVILNGFGTVVSALGGRCKPYLPQIAGTIKWRLNNKSPQVRMEASDLVSRVAPVMKVCNEDGLLAHLGVVLFECLGEEYPEVLGSILGGLKAVVAVIGMPSMQPPIKDLLPRLTPILKNRHERVQENCIDLIGRIADRGAEYVPAKEWMRICFDLLDMLKAPKKAIRRACVNTFGYIAKAIGPQDVLHALLNNLKVQERTMRVCTTIAIAIVAETCQPFTVLPALLNEYRIPDLQVQNGVLKALSFLCEYIGEQARDYVYSIVPVFEDALMERDPVHRQTAMFACKHLALGLQGLGCEDALQHLLNYIWPNIFETLPHVIQSFFEAIEGMRVSLGPHVLLQYLLSGLFHPARKVREPYWRVYNSLYVYASDALTPAYPAIPDEGYNRYTRTYLQLLL
jgi:splicing factor 3B subunit 1